MALALLLAAIILPPQDLKAEDLIDRLRWSDPKDREAAAAKLAQKGEVVLPDLEAALARTQDTSIIKRIEQVRARIRLQLHRPALDGAFSPAFRKVAPDLIEKLRNPAPEILLEGLEATTGYRARWNPQVDDFVTPPGKKVTEATKSDAALVFRIALATIPPGEGSESWMPVKAVMRATAHLHKTSTMLEAALIHLDDPDRHFRVAVMEMSEYGQRRAFIPAYLRLLESGGGSSQQAASKLKRMNPGEFAPLVAKHLEGTGGAVKAGLIECLSRTGDVRWKDVFLKHAEDPDEAVQEAAVRALSLLDVQAAVPHLLRMLRSLNQRNVLSGIHSSWALHDDRILKALESIVLHGSDHSAAPQALYALALTPTPSFGDTLLRSMKHESPIVRNAAAVNAHWVDRDDVVAGLEKLLDDPEAAVRGNAQKSLGTIREKRKGISEKVPAGPPSAIDRSQLESLLEMLETENEQHAFGEFMRTRSPSDYAKMLHLPLTWPKDRHPTVKELLEQTAEALKAKGLSLHVKLSRVDDPVRIRRNSQSTVVSLLFWLIPANLGHEYGWYLEEGELSLVPIDEARSLWRNWARQAMTK